MKSWAVMALLLVAMLVPSADADGDGIPFWGREVRQQLRDLSARVRLLERRGTEAGVLPVGPKLTGEERSTLRAVATAVGRMLSRPADAPWRFTRALTPGQVATFRVLGEGLDRGRFSFRWTPAGVGKESSFYVCMWELGSLFEHAHASKALKDDIHREKTQSIVAEFTSQLSAGNLEKARNRYRELAAYLKYIVK